MMSFCALICALVDAGLMRTDSAVNTAAPKVLFRLPLPSVSTGVASWTDPLAKFSQAPSRCWSRMTFAGALAGALSTLVALARVEASVFSSNTMLSAPTMSR